MSGTTVVIISKDEPGLRTTLQGLRRQVFADDFEVLVVDASSGRLEDIRRDFPEVAWIDFTAAPGRITIPEQRNRGVDSASGSVIAFIDAACRPADGWLDALLAPIRSGEESVTVGRTTGSGGSVYDHDRPTRDYVEEAATINLAFRREVYDAVGGFDESFDYGSDVDFTWRLRDAGTRLRVVPDAHVEHDWGSSRRQLKRAYRYGQARARLYVKHRARRASGLRRDPVAFAYPLFLLALPLAVWRPLRWIPALALIPLWRARRHQPLATLTDHLAYGAGVLAFLTFRVRRNAL